MRICLVTCRIYPDLQASDALYARALQSLGCEVIVLPWNAASLSAFSGHDAIVIRAAWDYQDDMPGYIRWLDGIERLGTPVFNAPDLIRWNNDKRCLLDLGAKGVAIPRTAPLAHIDVLPAAFDAIGTERGVLKPCWGGGGIGVELATRDNAASILQRLYDSTGGRDYMLQEFLPEIANGELSFIFIAGRHAHTVLKRPAPDEFRVNGRYNPLPVIPHMASSHLIAQAGLALQAAGGDPLYARIDGVVRDGGLICTEIEVNEPTLYMDVVPETAELFARETLQRLMLAVS